MIDLDATGPVYRGHKLFRIVDEYRDGRTSGALGPFAFWPDAPTSTKGWARLDVRVYGNPWGLSVSELDWWHSA